MRTAWRLYRLHWPAARLQGAQAHDGAQRLRLGVLASFALLDQLGPDLREFLSSGLQSLSLLAPAHLQRLVFARCQAQPIELALLPLDGLAQLSHFLFPIGCDAPATGRCTG